MLKTTIVNVVYCQTFVAIAIFLKMGSSGSFAKLGVFFPALLACLVGVIYKGSWLIIVGWGLSVCGAYYLIWKSFGVVGGFDSDSHDIVVIEIGISALLPPIVFSFLYFCDSIFLHSSKRFNRNDFCFISLCLLDLFLVIMFILNCNHLFELH